MVDARARYCFECVYFDPVDDPFNTTDNVLGVCSKSKEETGFYVEVNAYDLCYKEASAIKTTTIYLDGFNGTYSAGTGDLRGIFVAKEDAMDEKDKTIQDLRRMNKRLSDEYDELEEKYNDLVNGLKNLVDEMKMG